MKRNGKSDGSAPMRVLNLVQKRTAGIYKGENCCQVCQWREVKLNCICRIKVNIRKTRECEGWKLPERYLITYILLESIESWNPLKWVALRVSIRLANRELNIVFGWACKNSRKECERHEYVLIQIYELTRNGKIP